MNFVDVLKTSESFSLNSETSLRKDCGKHWRDMTEEAGSVLYPECRKCCNLLHSFQPQNHHGDSVFLCCLTGTGLNGDLESNAFNFPSYSHNEFLQLFFTKY